jgi:hypothetical protein
MERGVGLTGRDLQLYRFVGLLVGIVVRHFAHPCVPFRD